MSGTFFPNNLFFKKGLEKAGEEKIVQNVQTEPKGYPKLYVDTARVKFVHSEKNN